MLPSPEYVTLAPTKGGLVIALTTGGRRWLKNQVKTKTIGGDELFYDWNRRHHDILWDLVIENGPNPQDYDLLGPNSEDYVSLGALTDAPIILLGCERDDDLKIIEPGRCFWFPQYAVESELETLLEQGYVIFEEAK